MHMYPVLDGVSTRGLTMLAFVNLVMWVYYHGSIQGLYFEQVLWMITEFDIDKHSTYLNIVGIIKFSVFIIHLIFLYCAIKEKSLGITSPN